MSFKNIWRQAPVTVTLVSLMTVIFVVQSFISGQLSISTQSLYQSGAMFSPAVIILGQWWRLLTAGFLHVTFMHLVLNMVTLYYLGRLMEGYLGSFKYLLGYLVAVIIGNLNFLAFGAGNTVSAGASGGIFGLFGMIFLLGVLDRQGYWQAQAKNLGLFVILSLIPVFLGSHIAISAHIGGLIAGFLITPVLLQKGQATPKQIWVGISTLILYIGVLVAVIFLRH